jgi:glyoxylate reductase
MEILYHDRDRKEEFEAETGARWTPMDPLLAEADVVSVHVPSTSETRGMFGASLFGAMKQGAFFINTARGDLVDEEALLGALDNGPLGGAGLDVFSREPRVPRFLVEHPRIVCLPHIGSATTHTRRQMAELAVANARAVLAGEAPITPVPLPKPDE